MVINFTTGKEIAFTLGLLDKRTVVFACNSDEGTKLYMKIDKEPVEKGLWIQYLIIHFSEHYQS